MNNVAASWALLVFAVLGAPVIACTPDYNYVPPTLKAEIARSHTIAVATITGFRYVSDSGVERPGGSIRQGTFFVLFGLKGNLKTEDVVHVLDDTDPCGLSFSRTPMYRLSEEPFQVAAPNTWVLFLSGKPPYKLWESPRSGPLNMFSTEDMKLLFSGAPSRRAPPVQPNPALERP